MTDNSEREIRLSLISLAVRLTVGIIFFFAGLGKFLMGYSNYANWMVGLFKDTWLPAFALLPYTYALPFVEALCGLSLLVGIFTRWALFATALLMASLIFGQVILQKPEVVAHNLIYTILLTVGLWASEQDRFSLDYLWRKKRAGG